jgi:hypothetical protein
MAHFPLSIALGEREIHFKALAGAGHCKRSPTRVDEQWRRSCRLAPLGSTRLLVPYRASISTPMGVGILEATKFAFVPSEDNAREGR